MACTESKGYIWYIILELNKKIQVVCNVYIHLGLRVFSHVN